ncbi:MAG: NADH:ubiquinone reductase (Na(+)-transporting) subunit C [Candidatus Margulisbacteria bacterium]|nr:NADH:ubiquinone reductase (Na(+)-transporting) subunit C [Candidatus Margulisiibacteriota bacterium]
MWAPPKKGDLHDISKGSFLPMYLVQDNGHIMAYAFPISGYGLWSTLYGYMALEGDGETVKGVTIYQHGETPGLGGEAEKDWFLNQFKGKKIVNQAGDFVSVKVLKANTIGKIPDSQRENVVDGISGATITTFGMDRFLKKDLQLYEPFSRRRRR